MRAWLLELRRGGVRQRGEPPPSAWVEGFVTFTRRSGRTHAVDCCVFRRVIDPHPVPDWRTLFEPRIVAIGGGTLWLRGFERTGEAAVVQEWRLDVQRPRRPGEPSGPPLGEVAPSRR